MNTFKYYITVHFAVNLDRCIGTCNTLNHLSNRVSALNEIENLNLSVFNIVTGIRESKTSTKQITSKCKCMFDSRK